MKIDFNSSAVSHLATTDRAFKGASTSSTLQTASATSDRTTLSSSTASVPQLVAQAMTTPSVRQDKVDALKQAVSSGTYPIDNIMIAGSILDSGD